MPLATILKTLLDDGVRLTVHQPSPDLARPGKKLTRALPQYRCAGVPHWTAPVRGFTVKLNAAYLTNVISLLDVASRPSVVHTPVNPSCTTRSSGANPMFFAQSSAPAVKLMICPPCASRGT